MKFPKSIYFISAGVFCEKIAFFGIRTILPLYFIDIMHYSKNTAIAIFHAHGMLIYVSSLVGAIIADCWLGKFHTVLYFSIIYILGVLLLTSSSVLAFNLPTGIFTALGLVLTAVPGGIIKPCVVAFGGDQFKLPEQETFLKRYFSIYYFTMVLSQLVANFISPILRKDIICFGSNTCYPLAFAVPSIGVVAFTVIFLSGKIFYTIRKPDGNIIVKVAKCMCHAIKRKKSKRSKREHWLDYADDEYDLSQIEDIKSVLKLLKLFLPVPLFWALYEQLGSVWIFQATRMDGEIFSYLIKPDHMLFVGSICFVVLMPIFYFINPVLEKFLFINSPLRKMTVGLLMASLSFIVSGITELNLEQTNCSKLSSGLAQVRIFNTLNCNMTIYLNDDRYHLEALDMYQNLTIPVNEKVRLNVKAEFDNCPFTHTPNLIIKKTLDVIEDKATSWVLTRNDISLHYEDSVQKSKSGDPKLRALIYTVSNKSTDAYLRLESIKENYTIDISEITNFTDFVKVNHGYYNLSINNATVAKNLPIKFGGIYTVVGFTSDTHQYAKLVTLVEPNSVHMLWLLPQYILMAIADIMFSVNNLEFAYSQAPVSMKSLLQATYFLSISVGNLIVVVITKVQIFHRQALEVFFYAGLMLADVLIFAIMAKSYKSVKQNNISENKNIKLQRRKLLED